MNPRLNEKPEDVHLYCTLMAYRSCRKTSKERHLKHHEVRHHVNITFEMDKLDITSAESKATYEEIKKYVAEHNDGMKVSSLYIVQVKKKCGLGLGEKFNLPKSENAKQPQCPEEKGARGPVDLCSARTEAKRRQAIVEALKYFKMV